MTENKRYDVIYEKEPRGQVVTDTGIPCTARTCCTRLNWLEEENKELKEENEQLRLQLNLCSDQRNEFHRGVRENANRVGKLEKENEQLKDALNQRTDQCDKYYKENEQLYELINFANTLFAFKTSESCQKEWEKRLKELKE